MIQFNCDKCEMLIELDDDQAGTKHQCLNCGDTNRVPQLEPDGSLAADPESSVVPKPKDRAAEAGYPADDGPETRILKIRRCWFRSRAIRFSFVVLFLIAGCVGMLWSQLNDRTVYLILSGIVTVLGMGTLLWWWVDRLAASFEITTKRTIMHRGFFSKSSSEVVHDNIRNIQIDQT
ncbi:MAG: PH domain-containing protein, partial [Phycisphaerales bacterium]|nr:PH domain-containing protein [Phycisphaerales bacterium]